MAGSPTSRTLAFLRRRGFLADVVERWIPQAKRRKDLFGFIDIVAIANGQTVGVQATSSANMSTRIHKIDETDASIDWLEAGNEIWVVGWRKNAAGRWVERVMVKTTESNEQGIPGERWEKRVFE